MLLKNEGIFIFNKCDIIRGCGRRTCLTLLQFELLLRSSIHLVYNPAHLQLLPVVMNAEPH